MVAHNVELCHPARLHALDKVRHEEVWVGELVDVLWQREGQVVGIAIAIQDVEDGATGRLVRLQEENMVLGLTRGISVTGQKARCLFVVPEGKKDSLRRKDK